MYKLSLFLFFLFFPFSFFAQSNAFFSVYLVGDAGKDTSPGEALLMLKKELLLNPNSAVVFLGDNVYPNGMKVDEHARLCLESQLQILKEYKGKVYFIPGNHDWASQTYKGLKVLKAEQLYVQSYLRNNTSVANKNDKTFLPENGLPGPETLMLSGGLRLVIIDTQWFLHFYKKNKIISKRNTKELFYQKLDSILSFAKQNGEQVIVAAHHPLYTNGEHSRSLQPIRFLVNYTPFQIFGIFGLNRLFSQDMEQPRYKKMRKRILKSLNKYDNILYASGHDHNLQYFEHNGNRYSVSGAGSKFESLRKNKKFDSLFEDDTQTGFMKLDYSKNKKGDLIIYRSGELPFLLKQ